MSFLALFFLMLLMLAMFDDDLNGEDMKNKLTITLKFDFFSDVESLKRLAAILESCLPEVKEAVQKTIFEVIREKSAPEETLEQLAARYGVDVDMLKAVID